MTNVYAVIGQHKREQDRLLLLGDDGRCYASASPAAEPAPIDLTIAGSLADWIIETELLPASVLRALTERRAGRAERRFTFGIGRLFGSRA